MRREQLSRLMLLCAMLFCALVTGTVISIAGSERVTLAQKGNENESRTLQSAGWRKERRDMGSVHRERLYGEHGGEVSMPLALMAEEEGIRIPLPSGLGAEDILMENFYETRDILLIFPGDYREFLESSVLTASQEKVQGVYLSLRSGNTWLRVRLKDVYECQPDTEESMAVLSLEKPAVLYDRIVMLDAAGDDADRENDEYMFVWDVMEQIRLRLEEEGIGVYLTGARGTGLHVTDRAALVGALQADLVIGLRAGSHSTQEQGAWVLYNGDYFIPYFGNTHLALLLQQHIEGACLREADEGDLFLEQIHIPAAALVLDGSGQKLLADEWYREKLAAAIAETVLEALAGMQNS